MENLRKRLEDLLSQRKVLTIHNKIRNLSLRVEELTSLKDYKKNEVYKKIQIKEFKECLDDVTNLINVNWLYYFSFKHLYEDLNFRDLELDRYCEYIRYYIIYGLTNRNKIFTLKISNDFPHFPCLLIKNKDIPLDILIYESSPFPEEFKNEKFIEHYDLLEISDSPWLEKIKFKLL